MAADGLVPYAAPLLLAAEARGIPVRHIPRGFRDYGIPDSADQMRETLDIIDAEIRDGRAVYVHCWGGVGRTGVVVGCHLVRHRMTGEQALETVNALFHTMSPDKMVSHRSTGSPQTQCDFVRGWTE